MASDIARNESGEVARKAAEMHTVASAIADFPPQLLQGGRQYIASIDVKDVPIPITQSIGPSNVTMPTSSANTLHATLLLFNDVIVFAKRSANDRSKQLIGLDRANSVVAPSSGPLSPRKTAFRKDGLQFRGAVALSAVTAVNEGSSLGLHLDDPPAGLSARWVGRPTRRYIADANDKRFFLDKLWRAQAAMRLRPGATTVLSTSLSELAKGAGLGPAMDDAHVYFTIFSRAEWDREADKVRLTTAF